MDNAQAWTDSGKNVPQPTATTVNANSSDIVAAFDFDGTITRADSLRHFLRYVLGWPRLIWGVVLTAPWLLACAIGWISRGAAKERLLRATLTGMPQAVMQDWAQQFAMLKLPDLLRSEMVERIDWHRVRGHRLVLVSASPAVYLQPWAVAMGFTAVLATELEVVTGHYTGYLATPNCWGPEKIRRLEAWWGVPPAYLYAYGDSKGDAEMLARADVAWFRGQPMVSARTQIASH